MATLSVDTGIDANLSRLLMENDSIEPGDHAGYELCKQLWEFHPLGGKLVEKPITMALFKPRTNTVEGDEDKRLVTAFEDAWKRLDVTAKISNLFFVTRCYGAAVLAIGNRKDGSKTDAALELWGLEEDDVFINIFDPLNAAGSMGTTQDPNTAEFQQPNRHIRVAGETWHPSRTLRLFNGAPIYLSFQSSAFGYTGRSVFQRVVYPMKSFLQTMVTDNMVSNKAGVLVAKISQKNSVASAISAFALKVKRGMLKVSATENVISIGDGDSIESLDLQNVDKALTVSRDNIISNIAAGSDIPANLIKDEAFAIGFSDGTEDSKSVAQYIDSVRQKIDPVILFFERIVQHIAWSEAFFVTMQTDYPELYAGKSYKEVFYQWQQTFTSEWPPLMESPPETVQKSEGEVVKQVVELFNALAPRLDPANAATLVECIAEAVNRLSAFKDSPLVLDYEVLANYTPPSPAPPFQLPEIPHGQQESTEE
ncbi:anti-CBASS protein Acb1 family protein [Serratia fonticola]|uniref:anti-CBASS protein Acb1 family protein n=1 Tax=Serratia fonticola TaxID=47917 RepID=UPI00301D2AC9